MDKFEKIKEYIHSNFKYYEETLNNRQPDFSGLVDQEIGYGRALRDLINYIEELEKEDAE